MGGMRKTYIILVGKPEGKKILLQRPRPKWEDNMKVDLEETGKESVYRVHLGGERGQWQVLANTVMKLRVP
jgi:hypothetical protein